MPFEVKASRELAAIEIRLWNEVSVAELRLLAAAVMNLAKKAGLRQALVDCRGYLGGAGLRDVAALTYDVTNRPPGERGPEAFIAPLNPWAAKDLEFYVRTACSLGTEARIFASREAAIEWLRSSGRGAAPREPARASANVSAHGDVHTEAH